MRKGLRFRLAVWTSAVLVQLWLAVPVFSAGWQAGSVLGEEICTAQGIKHLPGGDSGDRTHPGGHCPFCSSNAHAPALPASDLPPFAAASGRAPRAGENVLPPRRLSTLAARQRAPPVLNL